MCGVDPQCHQRLTNAAHYRWQAARHPSQPIQRREVPTRRYFSDEPPIHGAPISPRVAGRSSIGQWMNTRDRMASAAYWSPEIQIAEKHGEHLSQSQSPRAPLANNIASWNCPPGPRPRRIPRVGASASLKLCQRSHSVMRYNRQHTRPTFIGRLRVAPGECMFIKCSLTNKDSKRGSAPWLRR
jgi:hypothetical protein